jgi:outer membrane protein
MSVPSRPPLPSAPRARCPRRTPPTRAFLGLLVLVSLIAGGGAVQAMGPATGPSVPATGFPGTWLTQAPTPPAAPVPGAPAPGAPPPEAPPPMPSREPLGAPTAIRPFPTPAPVVGRELSLEEAITIALENQPSIRVRLAEYAAARYRVNQALAPLFPQLGFSAGAFRSRDHLSGSPSSVSPSSPTTRSGTSYTTTASAGFSVEQRIFDFGKTGAATEAARSRAQSSGEVVEVERDEIVLAVKDAYLNLLFAKRLVLVNEAALDRANLNLRSARGFFDVGTRPKSDVTRAEVDVANARVDLIRALNAVNLFRVALNTAMGIAINTPTEVKDILVYEQFPIDRDALVGEALRRRAEYRQARFNAEAAEADVRRAFRDFFPELFGVGSHGLARTDGRTDVRSDSWEAGLELRWSIFDGGNRIARHQEAKALVEAVQATVRTLELSIWQEVEQAHIALVEAEERIGAAQKAVESAQENFRLSQGRFDAGVGTIIELTDAQLALTQAQSGEALALRDFRIGIARLERALGRR